MKRFFGVLFVAVLVLCSVCFALEDVDVSSDASYSLDDYDDFYNAYNDSNTQAELQEYYREYLAYSREQDAKSEPSVTYRAKVVDVGETKTAYGMDYYTPYRIDYQQVKAEVLEGEYKGKVFDVQYILTSDTYANLKIPEVHVGDKIFVSIELDDDGVLTANTSGYDNRVSRFGTVMLVLLAAAILIVVVARTKGLKAVLLAALVIDLVFVVTLPQVLKDNKVVTLEKSDSNFPTLQEIDDDLSISILDVDGDGMPTRVEVVKKSHALPWLILLDVLLISGVCLINHLGLSKKTVYAFGVTAAVLVFTALLAFGVNVITEMNGNSFEAITAAENIINKNIDFGGLYMLSVLVVASVIVPSIVAKVLTAASDEEVSDFLAGQVGVIVALSVVLLLPKVITLSIFKYSVRDLMNSEMLLGEFARMLVLLIAAGVTLPAAKLIAKREES